MSMGTQAGQGRVRNVLDLRPTPGGIRVLVAVIPALDEEQSIAPVIRDLLSGGVDQIIVADNGSRDRTVEVARSAGARVVPAARRGYGSACLAALAAVPVDARAVVFCDADGADDLSRLEAVTGPVLRGEADLVVGSRALGRAEPGALTPPQRMGNLVAICLMRVLYWRRVTDLGPFRCVSTAALTRLHMSDPTFGWTAEMQTKAPAPGPALPRSRRRCQAPHGRRVQDQRPDLADLQDRLGHHHHTILRHRFGRMHGAV
ncbi:MAG: glycosyltransferase family 2 protein [Chloroflexi bacterium]|nr:glycosyltransferase family 2 protein [Chloroflexota bacterium]